MILHHIKQASILDAHETASKLEKSLILLTFLPWHLNWLYNTNENHPPGWFFRLVAKVRFACHSLRSRRRQRSWVSKRKRLSIVFAQRYPTKQGVCRAEQAQATADDYATGESKSRKRQKSHLRNQKEKSRKRLFLFVLFTFLFSLFTFL